LNVASPSQELHGHLPSLTRLAAAFRHRPDSRELIAGAIGTVLLACLVMVDLLLGKGESIAGAFVLPPLLVALSGSVQATSAVAMLALIASIAGGAWNGLWGDPEHNARSAVVLVGGLIAVAVAVLRWRSLADGRRLELLDQIGGIADGSLLLDQTLARVTELIVPALADICIIDAIGAAGTTRMAVRAEGVPDPEQVESQLRDRRPAIPEYLQQSGRGSRPPSHFVRRPDDAILRSIAHDDGPDLEFVRSLGICSFVVVPLYARGRTLAALTLITTRHSGRTLERRDVRFAEVMSGRIALALDNAGLFSDLESVERRLDAVMNLVDEAVIVHDAEKRIVFANRAAARWLSGDDVDTLLDSPAPALEGVRLLDEAGTPIGPTADVLAHTTAPNQSWSGLARVIRADGERSWAEIRYEPIPGPSGELLFGVTTVHDVTSFKLAEFANAILSEVAQLLDSTRDYGQTLEGIAEFAVPRFADVCAVYLPGEERRLEPAAIAHAAPEEQGLTEKSIHLDAEHPVARAFRSGAPELLEISHGGFLAELGIHSALLVPLLAGPKVLGVITYGNRGDSRRFDANDLALAAEIGARVGLAVENARLATEEAEIAELLQLGLRPAGFPAISGWDLASMYRSAGEVTRVGGDFYDAFRVDDGWLLAIGDVVGRGAAAASLTALARYTLRTAANLTNDAERSLRRLHEAFLEHGKNELCSVALALLPDTASDPAEVLVLSAGHPLPLHLSSGRREIREVGSSGPLLGVFDSPSWPVTRVSLAVGDQLILYTDGVPEAKGEHGRFGDERLRERVATATDPATTVRNVERALDEFCPSGSGDDAALVAIQRLPRLARSRHTEAGQRRAHRERGRGLRPAPG
jgi:serine phosphatase RsbU (regulator of sigma subunit)/PAS domain-containing protein